MLELWSTIRITVGVVRLVLTVVSAQAPGREGGVTAPPSEVPPPGIPAPPPVHIPFAAQVPPPAHGWSSMSHCRPQVLSMPQ